MIELSEILYPVKPRDWPEKESDFESIFRGIEPGVTAILEKALTGGEISVSEGTELFGTRNKAFQAVLLAADYLRRRSCGDRVTFAIVRNINFTNICYTGCRFCAFGKKKDDPDAEFLSLEEIKRRTREARDRGATEICVQGGLHPNMKGTYYREIVKAIKEEAPEIHLHAFSPFEIQYGSRLSRMSREEFLLDLKSHGLDTIPGTAAEILDTDIRSRLTRNKLSSEEWISIIKTAHRLGIRSTATIMYGHIDEPSHWAAHIARVREIQEETGGFTEFVPLGFVHYDAPIFRDGEARPGPTREESLKMHAVPRLMLNRWIENIQVSWVKLGPDFAQQMLQYGVNDLGGTLMNESISRAAGARHGQEVTPFEMVKMIREAGRIPVQRNTLYETVEVFEDHDPPSEGTLVRRRKDNWRPSPLSR